MIQKRIIKVEDQKGFYYEVNVEHHPTDGFSIAYYRGDPIADRSYGRSRRPPQTDSDHEWEEYEEHIAEWCDEADTDLVFSCQQYFNSQYK